MPLLCCILYKLLAKTRKKRTVSGPENRTAIWHHFLAARCRYCAVSGNIKVAVARTDVAHHAGGGNAQERVYFEHMGCIFIARAGPEKWNHFGCQIPALKSGPDSGPATIIPLWRLSGGSNFGTGFRHSKRSRFPTQKSKKKAHAVWQWRILLRGMGARRQAGAIFS